VGNERRRCRAGASCCESRPHRPAGSSSFASIPSVSTDPAHAAGHRSRGTLGGRRGDGRRALRRAPPFRQPENSGRLRRLAGGAGASPTVLVYGHYDRAGRPTPLEKWQTPPWTPTERDGRLYAPRRLRRQGTDADSDLRVAEAFFATNGCLPVKLEVHVRGRGRSPAAAILDAFVQQHKALLAADVVVSADGAMWRVDEPSLTVASRGTLRPRAHAPRRPRRICTRAVTGGGVANPLHAMAALICVAARVGAAGWRVAGFYDEVRELLSEERAAPLPHCRTTSVRTSHKSVLRLRSASLAIRRSSVSGRGRRSKVNGMWGGYQGPGQKTVIPSEAHAKITCRLVPDQQPDEICGAGRATPRGPCARGQSPVAPRSRTHGFTCGAYRVPTIFALQAAAAALSATYGVRPLVVRMGGTVPVSDLFFSATWDSRRSSSRFSTADEDFHAPNEFFRLHRLHEGLEAWARLLADSSARRAHDLERRRRVSPIRRRARPRRTGGRRGRASRRAARR